MDIVPMVGDTLWLGYEEPGVEITGNLNLEATVIRRLFPIEEDDDVWLTARSDESVPEGYIANSPAWPSDDLNGYTVRKALEERKNGENHD